MHSDNDDQLENKWQIKWKTMQIKNWNIMNGRGMHKMHTWINFCAPWEESDNLHEWNDEEKGGGNAKFCHYIMCHLLYKHHHFASRRGITLQVEGTNAQATVEMLFQPFIKAKNNSSNVLYSRRYLLHPSTISC
jgi:hypothetical protein